MGLLKTGRVSTALSEAFRWHAAEPGNVVARVALGRALKAGGHPAMAARAFGSIIDLFPSWADMRRYAGAQLLSLGRVGLPLAVDAFSVAVKQRPDHVAGYRFLGYALFKSGRVRQAFDVVSAGLKKRYPWDRFNGYRQVLKEDLAVIGRAWLRRKPRDKGEILRKLKAHEAKLAVRPSLKFVLSWETDANDADLHVFDARKNHVFHNRWILRTGGRLYNDVTNGYGPEMFAIQGRPRAFPYRLMVHYASRGPMGYGMGTVQIIRHDGKGGLRFDDRPFIVMKDRAVVDLGLVKAGRPRQRRR